ncbi:hypothetical protein OEM_36180 [Mycobacterium intracellulare subsp. yongonense 05-1390]|nr:hypothetical protein OEM_36180 [Mycobacterium intracellulare subsp. yongonense 05-1390]
MDLVRRNTANSPHNSTLGRAEGASYLIQPRRRPHRSRIRTTRTRAAKPIRNQSSMWPTWLPRSIASNSPKMHRPTMCQVR